MYVLRITVSGDTLNREEREIDLRPLIAGEVIEFGDYVQLSDFPNFRAGAVVHGRKVLDMEAVNCKFWRIVTIRG